MKFDTTVAGKTGRLQIDANRFHYEREDGSVASGEFSIVELEPGTFSVISRDRSYRVVLGSAGEVSVNGRLLTVEVLDPRSLRGHQAGSAAHGRHNIVAPMPGKVVRLLVSVGDEVEEGQGLVVVEAMKMQNEMKSPKNGRVAEVRTKTDATVRAGDVLVVVE